MSRKTIVFEAPDLVQEIILTLGNRDECVDNIVSAESAVFIRIMTLLLQLEEYDQLYSPDGVDLLSEGSQETLLDIYTEMKDSAGLKTIYEIDKLYLIGESYETLLFVTHA